MGTFDATNPLATRGLGMSSVLLGETQQSFNRLLVCHPRLATREQIRYMRHTIGMALDFNNHFL